MSRTLKRLRGVFDDVRTSSGYRLTPAAERLQRREADPMPLPRHGTTAAAIDGTIYIPGGAPVDACRPR